MEYFGAIDQGTTSSRFIVFDNKGNIVEQHQEEFTQYFPDEYSVEHNPEEIWISVVNCINEVLKKININDIKSIGISNQRETTVAWSKSTGKPLFNAIVWQDTRTQSICDDISNNKNVKEDIKRTGLPIATYFSLSKILWLIDNVSEVQSSLEKDDLIFGTVDSWLIYKLNGTFQTDVTNASRTLLFDLDSLNWNDNLLNEFNIPTNSLPIIKPSLHNYGECKSILEGIPITAVLGDQQASLFGQHCFNKGEVKNTYGTGCFALTNTGDDIIYSNNGLLTTVAYKYGERNVKYALEGSVAIAGAAVQWLRDNLNLIETSEQIESCALEDKNNGGVYFVPAFSGLFSPHWDETARGVLAISQVIKDLDDPLLIIGYALGFAAGTISGSYIESSIAIGDVVVRIFLQKGKNSDSLTKELRSNGFGVTVLNGEGMEGEVSIAWCVTPRKQVKKVLSIVSEISPNAYVTTEATSPTYLTDNKK